MIVRMMLLLAGFVFAVPVWAHDGALNACGCHVDRATGECHRHKEGSCGCACQPKSCGANKDSRAPWSEGTEEACQVNTALPTVYPYTGKTGTKRL